MLAEGFFLPGAQPRQNGQSQHGQGDVPIPALPVPDFVMIQSALAFGHLESAFDGPALSGDGHQGLQTALLLAGIREIEGVLGLGFQTAPRQQRMLPSLTLRPGYQGPIVEPFALGAVACDSMKRSASNRSRASSE